MDSQIVQFILSVALILSSAYLIVRRRSFVKPLDKIVAIIALASLVIGIPLFIYAGIDSLVKIITGIAIIIIILVVKFWENIRGQKVTIELGDPYEIVGNIQRYKNRSDLPLEELLSLAKKEIIFASITHYTMSQCSPELIKDAIINQNVVVKIYILIQTSPIVDKQSFVFGKAIKQDIVDALDILCKLQKRLPEGKLILKTYDDDLPYSIIVIDREGENPIIKIEEHIRKSDPNYRPSRAVFRKDNESRYNDFITPLINLKNISDYSCPS